MNRLLIAFLLVISSSSLYAGEPVITETDTGITVEYTGDVEDAHGKASLPGAKSGNPSISEDKIQEAMKAAREARRAQREERQAERAARRSAREPRNSEE